MLSDLCDRLGLDVNEAGWSVAFAMEAFEKGVISRKDADGLELTWGNVEAARQLLINIAYRRGYLGGVLAEGLKRGAEAIGGEALDMAVYMEKGNTPRGHDHRARWNEILDYATSGAGTIEAGPVLVRDRFNPEDVAQAVAKQKTLPFMDSLVTCTHATGTFGGGRREQSQLRSPGRNPGSGNRLGLHQGGRSRPGSTCLEPAARVQFAARRGAGGGEAITALRIDSGGWAGGR